MTNHKINPNMTQPIKVIITGATGMVGEGVLHECLHHPSVSAILLINRKPSGFTHHKIKEIVHSNFYDFSAIEQELVGYNACFFCLGTSSIGKNEEEFTKITYTLTMHVAQTLARLNPDMTFCYISGGGTDSTEKGKLMWARVKGKTENDLMKLPFKRVYNFRPGYLHPTEGLKNTLPYYKYITWLYPVLRFIFRNNVSTLRELGLAMIHSISRGYAKQILEVKDIVALAK
ncbi:MAG: NAD-dependent epimerase/dehydratase family protein [Saprospiraceae bacterium]|nr:NAD-dependent epimerase/dehydratase family protein [Saprospiraceae bacterium]